MLSIWTGERGCKYVIHALQPLPAWLLMTLSIKWVSGHILTVSGHGAGPCPETPTGRRSASKIKTNFWWSLVVLTSEDTWTRDALKPRKLFQLLWAHVQLHPVQADPHPEFQNKVLLFSQLKANTQIWTFGAIVCWSYDLACSCKPQPTGTAGVFSDRAYIDGNSYIDGNLRRWIVACKCNVHVWWINKVFKLIMIAINDIWKKWNWTKTSTLEHKSSSRSDSRWLSQFLDWSSDEGTSGF